MNIEILEKYIDQINALRKEDLLNRAEWGPINFNEIEDTLKFLFKHTKLLKKLPLEYLPDNVVNDANNSLGELIGALNRIKNFKISEHGNKYVNNHINDVKKNCMLLTNIIF